MLSREDCTVREEGCGIERKCKKRDLRNNLNYQLPLKTSLKIVKL